MASLPLTASLLTAAASAVLLAAAPFAATASPAGTATADGAPAVAVPYGDLNLATEHGARVLFERIRLAAEEVCPRPPDIRDLGRVAARNRCVRQAIAGAVREVGSPRLAAVLSAQSGHG